MFVSSRDEEPTDDFPAFQRVLPLANPTSIAALPDFDRLVIHQNNMLFTCSLEALARTALSAPQARGVDVGHQRITPFDDTILFFRVGRVGNRTLRTHIFEDDALSLADLDIQSYLLSRACSMSTYTL